MDPEKTAETYICPVPIPGLTQGGQKGDIEFNDPNIDPEIMGPQGPVATPSSIPIGGEPPDIGGVEEPPPPNPIEGEEGPGTVDAPDEPDIAPVDETVVDGDSYYYV